MSRTIISIPISQIEYTPDPHRDAEDDKLDKSIKSKGLLQPIIATYSKGKFQLRFGGRRFEAAKRLKLKEIPVILREADDLEATLLRLHENIHRENYSPTGLCNALTELRDKHGMMQKDIAKAIGKTDAWVSKVLSISKLPEAVKEKIESGEAKIGVERASEMARIREPEKVEKLAEKDAPLKDVRKASRGRKLKYEWKHKGKTLDGISFTARIIFNNDEIETNHILEALEICEKGI